MFSFSTSRFGVNWPFCCKRRPAVPDAVRHFSARHTGMPGKRWQLFGQMEKSRLASSSSSIYSYWSCRDLSRTRFMVMLLPSTFSPGCTEPHPGLVDSNRVSTYASIAAATASAVALPQSDSRIGWIVSADTNNMVLHAATATRKRRERVIFIMVETGFGGSLPDAEKPRQKYVMQSPCLYPVYTGTYRSCNFMSHE